MRKVLSAILATVMLLSVLSVFAAAQELLCDDTYEIGNIDRSEDGSVNAIDVYCIRSYITGYEVNADLNAADINGDGKVDTVDVYLLRCILVSQYDISDFDNGKQIYTLQIGGTDISEFDISLPDYTSDETNGMYTAETLQKYILEATGNRLRIVRGASDSDHSIIIQSTAGVNLDWSLKTKTINIPSRTATLSFTEHTAAICTPRLR